VQLESDKGAALRGEQGSEDQGGYTEGGSSEGSQGQTQAGGGSGVKGGGGREVQRDESPPVMSVRRRRPSPGKPRATPPPPPALRPGPLRQRRDAGGPLAFSPTPPLLPTRPSSTGSPSSLFSPSPSPSSPTSASLAALRMRLAKEGSRTDPCCSGLVPASAPAPVQAPPPGAGTAPPGAPGGAATVGSSPAHRRALGCREKATEEGSKAPGSAEEQGRRRACALAAPRHRYTQRAPLGPLKPERREDPIEPWCCLLQAGPRAGCHWGMKGLLTPDSETRASAGELGPSR